MAFKIKDLTNQVYGKLTVIKLAEVRNRNSYWLCSCSCGEIKAISACNLRAGTQSCGCIFKEKMKGNSNPAWKGGVTPENKAVRNSQDYALWRISVFSRDAFCCKKCNKKGTSLHAHHIESFATNKNLRTDIDNGVTLCQSCHLTFHKLYGKTNNNSTQLKEYFT